MPDNLKLHTDIEFARAIRSMFQELDDRLGLTMPVTAYVAGGVAVHLYTAYRVSSDIDAEFSHRVLIPDDLYIEVPTARGVPQLLHFDQNYNSTFALMHDDYREASIPVPFDVPHFKVRALAPVDLAVSKISRFVERDQADIQMLVEHRLTNAAAIEARAMESIPNFVGRREWLELNIRDAVRLALNVELRQLGYTNETISPSEPGKTYQGLVVAVLRDQVIQATPQGVVAHSRQSLVDSDLLAAGRHLEIAYPHGHAGLVQVVEAQREAGREDLQRHRQGPELDK